jgi:vacuolar-type H+-ATPase subunit H
VRALKEAEKSAASQVEGARAEAARIEAAARESSVEMISKAGQKAVEAKNEILARRREQTESEVGSILGAAKKQAGAIRAKRLSDTDVAEISQDI